MAVRGSRKRKGKTRLPSARTPEDLVTANGATSVGFLEQAQTKADKAAPHLRDALELREHLRDKRTLDEALRDGAIYRQLAAGAGFSEKALGHVSQRDIKRALQSSLGQLSRRDWREELVYRFLLTRGDSLGGFMRNYAGYRAASKFSTLLADELDKTGIRCVVDRAPDKPDKVNAVTWEKRLIVFNRKFPHTGKNVDAILLAAKDGMPGQAASLLKDHPHRILACGELKGGVDPAGADEHWKTANSALQRIRQWRRRSKIDVKLFFVGGAIVTAMAAEIWAQLRKGDLDFAANLNHDAQMRDLVRWLAAL